MNRHTVLGMGGSLVAVALLLAACGGSTGSTASATAAATAATAGHTAAAVGPTPTGGDASSSATIATPAAPLVAAVDPCGLITPDEARAALGGDPGPGKRVTGSPACTYGTPGGQGGYLLVGDADKDHIPGAQGATQDVIRAKAQEQAAKVGATVQDTSGIGDFGFLVIQPGKGSSYIFFVKGSTFVSIVLISPGGTVTADVMTTLAKAAADRV